LDTFRVFRRLFAVGGLEGRNKRGQGEVIKETKESLSAKALCDGVLLGHFAMHTDYTRSLGFD
jgi:hypothetical protein